MYVPASFAVSDEKTLESFVERYDFATLTSSSSEGLVARGRARDESEFTAVALRELVAKYEGSRAKPWRSEDLAGDVFEKLAKAIVAFEMPIDGIEGKFKLGQNRSEEDRIGMLEGLDAEKSPDADALAAFIRKTLKSLPVKLTKPAPFQKYGG